MLKGIPAILSPELLKVMMEMGHGDEITIGDGNSNEATGNTGASVSVTYNRSEKKYSFSM